MDEKSKIEIKQRYMAAAESFVSKIKDDPNIIAVIICGSLAYDDVWEKSDIDMTVVVRDQHLKNDNYSIIEDGITINVYLMARSGFKRGMERNIGGSFSQAYFANGKIIYTKDDSLYEYFDDIKKLGSDDIALSSLYMAAELVGTYEKCQKWLRVKKDTYYAQYYLLKAAETIANMEICFNGEPSSRSAIQKAIKINPEMMKIFYTDPMSRHLSEEELEEDIEKIDSYLLEHMDIIKRPVMDFMADQQIKTCTMIADYFHVESHFIINIFDYIAEKGIIEKVSQTIRLTPKGRLAVEEIGYLYIPEC